VTSAEQFPEETQVPPIVLDTPALPIGSILRDDNLDDQLEVQAELSVVGQSMSERICPQLPIAATGRANRDQFTLVIDRARIKQGACSKVDVYVSKEFRGSCTEDTQAFALPSTKGDLAHALFWIWEMSQDPTANPGAAQGITTTCQTVTHAPTTSMVP
jgi:hypothetical protein